MPDLAHMHLDTHFKGELSVVPTGIEVPLHPFAHVSCPFGPISCWLAS